MPPVSSARRAAVYSMYVGEGERIVRDVFMRARRAAPAVVLLDEIDGIASKRAVRSLPPPVNRSIDRSINRNNPRLSPRLHGYGTLEDYELSGCCSGRAGSQRRGRRCRRWGAGGEAAGDAPRRAVRAPPLHSPAPCRDLTVKCQWRCSTPRSHRCAAPAATVFSLSTASS